MTSKRDAEQWEKILGVERKAELDERVKDTLSGGFLDPAEALYWHTLVVERYKITPSQYLLYAAQHAKDSDELRGELVGEINENSQRAAEARHWLLNFLFVKERNRFDALKLSEEEVVWLMLRVQPAGETKLGTTKYLSQKEIATTMDVTPRKVQIIEERLAQNEPLQAFLSEHKIPDRKPRNKAGRNVAKGKNDRQ